MQPIAASGTQIERRPSRAIAVGKVIVGGSAPVVVQSMTKTDTRDVVATVGQIREMEKAGCELVRLAIPDMKAADALGEIRRQVEVPLVADIHFDYRLALKAIEKGADGLRINPGNIGGQDKLERVVRASQERRMPIRIGVNAGSLERELLQKTHRSDPSAMVESALRYIEIFEGWGFSEIKLSLKSSDPWQTIQAYRMIARQTDYPLHLGITEAGTLFSGLIKSAVGIGVLLAEGIGDTVRVSLSEDPVMEVRAAYAILGSLGLRRRGVEVISCPTCGRCQLEVISLAKRAEAELSSLAAPLKVAIMGCEVNGPGEAREADVGITGGKGRGLLFKKGEVIRKVEKGELYAALMEEVKKLTGHL